MFYTESSKGQAALQLKWFGLVANKTLFLHIYEVRGGVVEIITNKKGNYIHSKLITDEYF
jgi:hypothetical protein